MKIKIRVEYVDPKQIVIFFNDDSAVLISDEKKKILASEIYNIFDYKKNKKYELEKLKEETEELLGAVIKYKTNEFVLIDNVIEEGYDVIQVVVNIIDRLGLIDYMQEGLERHIEKLKGRGWKFKNE